MKTQDHPEIRRILVIDDQNSIHETFRTVFLRSSMKDESLMDMELELFGDPAAPLTGNLGVDEFSNAVEFAYQGEEGFQKLQAALQRGEKFHLAFVDMQMPPGWNGIETIRQLWTLAPALPIVVCTAYSEYSWGEICTLLGNVNQLFLLPKPFLTHEVHNIMNEITGPPVSIDPAFLV